MLNKVTITGADDSINPDELLKLSEEFPFVEWGILVSRKQFGAPRFPSLEWMMQLPTLNLSLHLCGAYVRELLLGNFKFATDELPIIWEMFRRVQINTHGEKHSYNQSFFDLLRYNPEKEFIFQFDNVNNLIIQEARNRQENVSALFDLSHGAGLLPGEWPFPLVNVKCGYAGGLSALNLKDQIGRIMEKTKDKPFWIDMETHVRTHEKFDLEKVRECLMICAPFVYPVEQAATSINHI